MVKFLPLKQAVAENLNNGDIGRLRRLHPSDPDGGGA